MCELVALTQCCKLVSFLHLIMIMIMIVVVVIVVVIIIISSAEGIPPSRHRAP